MCSFVLLLLNTVHSERPPTFQCNEMALVKVRDLYAKNQRPRASSTRLMLIGSFGERWMPNGDAAVDVVLKFAGSSYHSTADELKALRRESEVYLSLAQDGGSTGCVRFHCVDPSSEYIVLERHGQDLRSFLHTNIKNPLYLVRAVVEAVLALHARGIMHGNICPDNITCISVTDDRNEDGFIAKLCDLQAARPIREFCIANTLGSLYYTAPEVHRAGAENIQASLAIDVFSLGLIIWQILHNTTTPALASAPHPTALHLMLQAELHSYLPLPSPDSTYIHRTTNVMRDNRMTGDELLACVPAAPKVIMKHPLTKQDEEDRNTEISRMLNPYSYKDINKYSATQEYSRAPSVFESDSLVSFPQYISSPDRQYEAMYENRIPRNGPPPTSPVRTIEQYHSAVCAVVSQLSAFYSAQNVAEYDELVFNLKRECVFYLNCDQFENAGKCTQLLLDLSGSKKFLQTFGSIHNTAPASFQQVLLFVAVPYH